MTQDDEPVVTRDERRLFDRTLEGVLAGLPDWVHELLERVPLIVEDYPADHVLDEMGVDDPSMLCGLHTGVPLTERSVQHSGVIGDTITIYRDGIFNSSLDRRGYVDEAKLETQIRITVLHEIGHHFGLDEDDLRRLGYG